MAPPTACWSRLCTTYSRTFSSCGRFLRSVMPHRVCGLDLRLELVRSHFGPEALPALALLDDIATANLVLVASSIAIQASAATVEQSIAFTLHQ